MVTTIKPKRSALYMPASNARAIEKARTLDVDVVILDLEDAVAPDLKLQARAQAVQAALDGGFGDRELVVRINGFDTPWGADDLAAVTLTGVDAVLLPKVSDPETLTRTRAALSADPCALWAMIETTRAMFNLQSIVDEAQATGLTTLVAGTNDLAKELRCRPGVDRAPLLDPLARIVLAARYAGLNALDGVCNVLDDSDVLRAECLQGLRWGFDGKTLIHPAQIEITNSVFTPSPEEIAWAREITTAFDLPENAGRGALRVAGKMVELLHLDEARRTLAIAAACGA